MKLKPSIEDHLPGPEGRRWSGRRNITLWLKDDIIDRCQPHPASQLRQWIEDHFPIGPSSSNFSSPKVESDEEEIVFDEPIPDALDMQAKTRQRPPAAEVLKAFRKMYSLTQVSAAEWMYLPAGTYRDYEQGRGEPSLIVYRGIVARIDDYEEELAEHLRKHAPLPPPDGVE